MHIVCRGGVNFERLEKMKTVIQTPPPRARTTLNEKHYRTALRALAHKAIEGKNSSDYMFKGAVKYCEEKQAILAVELLTRPLPPLASIQKVVA